MDWAWINPRWRDLLHRHGLVRAADFLRAPGVILCGHPDRHVLKIDIGSSAYLKKEHRVPWRDRLTNAWAGYGFASKSTREALTLQHAARAGLACAEVLAHGELDRQAFLLLSHNPGTMEVRQYLAQQPNERTQAARALGQVLARLHDAGIEHGDLYSKHVLVGVGARFCILDWQRARQWRKVPLFVRRLELATLDATLPDEAANDRLRLSCLRAYLGESRKDVWKSWALAVRLLSLALQKKRRIQNLRRMPLATGTQNLVWLDGEALCVTRTFKEELGDQIPDWLRLRSPRPTGVQRTSQVLPGGRTGTLVRRFERGLAHRLRCWWRRRPAPEVTQAATIYHLERYQVSCPKLLAFGQEPGPHGRESFLLTENASPGLPLRDVLNHSLPGGERRQLLRRAGEAVRRIHESGHVLNDQSDALRIGVTDGAYDLALARIDGLVRVRRSWSRLAASDLPGLSWLGDLSRADKLRFIHGYLRIERLNKSNRALVKRLFARLPREAVR